MVLWYFYGTIWFYGTVVARHLDPNFYGTFMDYDFMVLYDLLIFKLI